MRPVPPPPPVVVGYVFYGSIIVVQAVRLLLSVLEYLELRAYS